MDMISEHRIGGLRIRRVDLASPSGRALSRPRDDLPDLEPAEDRLRRLKKQIFRSNSIQLSHASAMDDVLNPHDRPEHHDVIARATVYVMTMIALVMAMPVGLALLFFNIFWGENLRTTAHTVALTGMGLALAETPTGMALIGYLPAP